MTKKSQVHFSNRERRPSKGSLEDMDGSNGSVRSPSRSSGAKSPTRSNGSAVSRGKSQERPGYDRTDTSASGWATENEDDEKVRNTIDISMVR